MSPFESLDTVSYSPSIVTMPQCVSFQRQSKNLVEIRDFFIPLAFDAPLGGSLSECYHTVWCGKTRMTWLPGGGKSVSIISSRFDRIPACDGRTNRQTDRHLATA